jgi:tRNA dimethylallyltransferase
MANHVIKQIHQQQKTPILVGGTGLYINAVTQNYLLPEAKPDQQLRNRLTQLADQEGVEAVHHQLQEIDPASAANIHPHNLRYVIRAIEIATHTQKPKSDRLAASPYHTFYITIDWPRDELYQRIDKRIDLQLEHGFLEETRQLLQKYDPALPSLSSLGYQEIGAFLKGETSLEQAVNLFKQNTRHYAKRQLTWFRKTKPVYFVSGNQLTEFIEKLHQENL